MEQRSTPVRTKLLARDISDSLGKLPPTAPEMEAAVLGAILISAGAIDKVAPYLKPSHFYTEANKLIYRAALNLHHEKEPIDLLTVRNRLRTDGHIETIGGAYYLSELTSNVTSSANIEAHARVVIEKAMARDIIQVASSIHAEAYEDVDDVFDLLDQKILKLQALRDTSTKQTPESIVKAQWETRFLKTAPPKTVPLIVIDGCPIVTVGNYTLLIGKKKTRKTLFMVWLISEYLRKHPEHAQRIILFDTEQGMEEVWEIVQKIHTLCGLWVNVAYMRGMSPRERKDFILYTVKQWPHGKPVLCSIDGIRDLMSNINDPDESTDLMVWLDRLTMENDLAIINVIHMNKADTNARGHIGTELANKSLCTIEMELDSKTELTVVKCESSRKKPFDSFAFTHSGDGLPTLADMPVNGRETLPKSDIAKRLEAAFTDGPMKFKDAWTAIGTQFECAETRARRMLAKFVRDGMVMKNGKDRDPHSTYKLISSDVPDAPAPNLIPLSKIIAPNQPQPDLFSTSKNGTQIHKKKEEEIDPDSMPF